MGTDRATPSQAAASAEPISAISTAGLRPKWSEMVPDTGPARSEPTPSSATSSPVRCAPKPRDMRYSARKGKTKVASDETSAPLHNHQKMRGMPENCAAMAERSERMPSSYHQPFPTSDGVEITIPFTSCPRQCRVLPRLLHAARDGHVLRGHRPLNPGAGSFNSSAFSSESSMLMRQLAAASVVGTLLWACGSEPGPTLTLTPSGTQTISAPITITAGPPTLAASVTWSFSGPGTLSGTSGPAVVYRPPPLSNVTNPPTATVTATAKGQTASLTLQLATPTVPNGVIAGLKSAAQVYTDAQDIPHVFCGDPLDCFAVQGYLQARDRLFQMDLFRRTARGQLAALVGPLEVSSDTQFLRLFTTRDGKKIEDQLVLALDLDLATKAKLVAFCSGVNAYLTYLKANPTLMPGEYAQIAAGLTPNDIPAWTPADTLAIGRLQQFGLSETIEKEVAYGLFARTFAPAAAGGVHPDAGRFAAYVRAKQPLAGYKLSPSDSGLPPPSAPPAPTTGSSTEPTPLRARRWRRTILTCRCNTRRSSISPRSPRRMARSTSRAAASLVSPARWSAAARTSAGESPSSATTSPTSTWSR